MTTETILTAMAIGAVLYASLQVVMIGSIDPANLVTGWGNPLGSDPSAYGAWYTLALAIGAGWLAKVLLIDAVISPAGTGVVYVGATARLSYALGEEREMPKVLASTTKKGVPLVSILVGAVIGCVAFGPFKSWSSLVSVITGATAIMYAFAPISLAALRKLDSTRPRAYRVPLPSVVLPGAFCSANLIMYWGGFATIWKLALAMLVGLLLFAIGAWRAKTDAAHTIRNAIWIVPWLGGHVIVGALGRYGGHDVLPQWIDILAVLAFSVAIFRIALHLTLTTEAAAAAIAKDAHQLDYTAAT